MNANVKPRNLTILESFSNGLRIAEIARLVGMSPQGVWYICKKYGQTDREKPARKRRHSPEFIARLVNDYRAGDTFLQIAEKHGLTRNQVGGILSRAGVLNRMEQNRVARVTRPKQPKKEKLRVPKFNRVPFAERAAQVAPLNIPFLDRKRDQCAYLYGDDPKTMTCCGHQTYGTTSWCLAHAQIVFTPYQARAREARPR